MVELNEKPRHRGNRGLSSAAEGLHWFDRGVAYGTAGRMVRAAACYRRAIALAPECAEAHNNLAVLAGSAGRLAEARAALDRALALSPSYSEAWNNLGVLARDEGDMEDAYRCYERSLHADRNARNTQHNLLMVENYLTEFPLDWMSDDHTAWGEQFEERYPALPRLRRRSMDPNRPLRVGYLSGDFLIHSVSYFIEAALAYPMPGIRTYCYSNLQHGDVITAYLRSLAHRWREVHGQSASDVARLIRRDRIDILVDLSGHTSGNRLDVMALRPAPVAVTYLGYPNTTGLRTIDYRITDADADPWDTEQRFTEALVRLPRCFLCFTPPYDGPEIVPPPHELRGHVTFACFNALCKVNHRVLATWARILAAVPGSRLLLKNKGSANPVVRARLIGRLKDLGVDPQRVTCLPLMATRWQHLSAYGEADIALDTFPYAGTATTCEALWMGLPVVTLTGTAHAHNVGRSLLGAVGMNELVTDSEDAYVAAACALAADHERLSATRRSLRERMLGSELCDVAGFGETLAEAYRAMWRQARRLTCKGR